MRCSSPRSGPHVLMFARFAQPYGGVVRYVNEVSRALRDAGSDVTVAYNLHEQSPEVFSDFHRLGIRSVNLTADPVPDNRARAMDEIIGAVAPDIIHFNDGSRITRQCVKRMRTLRCYEGRRIVTLHADIFHLGQRHRHWRAACPWTQDGRARREASEYVKTFDRIISVSEVFAEKIPALAKISPGVVYGIPNGIDTELFRPRLKQKASDQGVKIAASGGFFRYKRFDTLLAAAARLVDRYHIRILIAGSGREEARLREMAKQLGIAAHVEFVGVIANMPEFLGNADIFAFCSDATETSSFSQLEAMATGLPSVCSRYGDVAIRVRDGVDGFLVVPGDAEMFARKLERLVRDDVLRCRMGAQARRRVCDAYSKDMYVRRTVNVINGAVLHVPAEEAACSS